MARALPLAGLLGQTPDRGPDVAAVRALHRHDGFLTVSSKRGGVYKDLFSLAVSEAEQLALPGMADALASDAFFSVHGMAIAGRRAVTFAGIEAMRAAMRKSEYADYLTAAYLDCDCYRDGLAPGEAMGRLETAAQAGVFPSVSFYLLSGRGVWPFWLLADGSGRVPKTGGRERRLWAGIEKALAERVRPLAVGLDEGATDLARVCRLPGTINSAAADGFGEEVRFAWMTDAAGGVAFYVLDELADALGIASWEPRIVAGGAGATPGRATGWRALWQGRLAYLDALQIRRGGYWHEGHRNNALFLLALFLRKTGHPESMIRDTVERAGLASGLRAGEAAGIVRKIERLDVYRRISDEKIRAWLGVTAREAEAIGWAAPDRDWSATARAERRDAADNRDKLEAERQAERRALVREYARTVGAGKWSVYTLQAWREKERGTVAAHRTLLLDLDALGILTPGQAAKQAQGRLAL